MILNHHGFRLIFRFFLESASALSLLAAARAIPAASNAQFPPGQRESQQCGGPAPIRRRGA